MFYVFLVVSILLSTIFNLISRSSLSKTKYEHAYTVIWQVACALLAFLFLPLDTFVIIFSPFILMIFGISILFWALNDAFVFTAYKYEEASVLSAILPFNYVITFVVSIWLFNMQSKLTTLIGFAIIIFAAYIMGFHRTKLRISRGVIFGFLSAAAFGVALAFNGKIANDFSITSYMFFAFFFPAIINIFIFLRPKHVHIRYELSKQWRLILLNAFLADASYFFLIKAFQQGSVPQAIALSATSTFLTALGGIFFLKERKGVFVKLFAAALATVGVILVNL